MRRNMVEIRGGQTTYFDLFPYISMYISIVFLC